MDKTQQFSLWYFLGALIAMLAVQNLLFPQHTETLQYSEFKTLLKQGKVGNVTVSEQAIAGTLAPEGLEGLLPPEKLEPISNCLSA